MYMECMFLLLLYPSLGKNEIELVPDLKVPGRGSRSCSKQVMESQEPRTSGKSRTLNSHMPPRDTAFSQAVSAAGGPKKSLSGVILHLQRLYHKDLFPEGEI